MNLQFISDNKGNTTAVFIPIQEWERLKRKFKELENEEPQPGDIPEWQKEIVRERLKAYKENPDDVIELDEAMWRFNLGE